MQQAISRRYFYVSSASFAIAHYSIAATADDVISISSGEYAPWTSSKSPHRGFINRVVKECFARRGLQVEFTFFPWIRAERELQIGRVTASSFWFYSEVNKSTMLVSDPVSSHQIRLFNLKSKPIPKWKNLTELSQFKMGLTSGYTYTNELWSLVKSGRLQATVVNSDEQNLEKLLIGRIDLFPSEIQVIKNILRDHPRLDISNWDRINANSGLLYKTTGHIRFLCSSSDSGKLLKILNNGLAELKKDGTYMEYWKDLQNGIF